jgi:hypothetical protein
MGQARIDTVIEKYIELREKRAILKRAYEQEDFILKEAAEKVEGWLLKKLNEEKVESFKTAVGTAYIAQETRASCADWPSFWQFCADNQLVSLLEKRVSISAIKEFEETNGQLPPFINKTVERVVRVRKST